MSQSRYITDKFNYYVMNQDVNLSSGGDDIKVALYQDDFVVDVTDETMDDITGTELGSGDGYTAGGETLANQAILDNGGGEAAFDADNPSWTFTASKTFQFAVFYKDAVAAADQLLLGVLDIQGANLTIPDGEFRLIWNSAGLFPIAKAT